jgi:hypothetical protein
MEPMQRRRSDWLTRWRQRHQHPASLWLHLFGVPMTITAGVLAILQLVDGHWEAWWRPMVLVAGGYALQYIEGNDMGEIILIKRLLRRPYTAVSPRYRRATGESPFLGRVFSSGAAED